MRLIGHIQTLVAVAQDVTYNTSYWHTSLLVAEKSGFQLGIDTPEMKDLRLHAEKLVGDSTPAVKLPEKAVASVK